MHLLLLHTYAAPHMAGSEAPRGWTGPDMEAAQQLVHLSSDEEEYYCGSANGGSSEATKSKAAEGTQLQLAGAAGDDHEGRKATSAAATREGKGAGEELDDEAGLLEDGKGRRISCSRKRRFRSIAYLYRVTMPVIRTHDEAKRRKNIHSH